MQSKAMPNNMESHSIPVKVKKLNEHALLPSYGTERSAGADLSACLEEDLLLKAGSYAKIPTG